MDHSDRIRLGFWVGSGHFQVNYVRVGVGFGSDQVQVRVTYGYHVRVGMDSVQVEFRSGLFRIVYSSSIRIGYRLNVIWNGWDSVQCLD